MHICYSRCPLSNAIKLLLLQDIIIILCAITQLMYVEMANNCFKKYSEVGSQYQCTEQSVCVCVCGIDTVCIWYTYCSESSSCIICFLSMRTCNNTSKACRPCAVHHLPTRLLQAAGIRFCSRQPQVDATIHSHGVVCARHRRLDPLIELGDRCTCCRHDTLKADEACLRTLRPHFRVQALISILCCAFQAATQQIRVAESHIDLLDMSRDLPCQWRAQLVAMGTWLLSRCQRPLEETPAVAANGAA